MEDDGGTFSAVRAFCENRDVFENRIIETFEDNIDDIDSFDLSATDFQESFFSNKKNEKSLKHSKNKETAKPKGKVTKKTKGNVLPKNSVNTEPLEEIALENSQLPRRSRRFQRTEVIDLITSPPLVYPQVISLDSDEETASTRDYKNNDVSFELENLEIKVKIKWQGKIQMFAHRKHQKFQDIMEKLAQKENVSINDIYLKLDERMIKLDDTPDSIDYKTHNFIIGRIVHQINSDIVGLSKKDPNIIEVKIQSNMWKKPFTVKLKKTDEFKLLYIKVSEETKLSVDEVTLSFDGELLNFNETPNDLELEGGEIIDCHRKK